MLSCQKLGKSVVAKSDSVKGMTRAIRSGGENMCPLVSAILILMEAHQPWKRKELLSFGEAPLKCIT